MGIDIAREMALTIGEAAKWLQSRGWKTSRVSVWRWIRSGVQADDGSRVYLEFARLGGEMRTSVEALQRLVDNLQRATVRQRQHEAAQVEAIERARDQRREDRRRRASERSPEQEEVRKKMAAMGILTDPHKKTRKQVNEDPGVKMLKDLGA